MVFMKEIYKILKIYMILKTYEILKTYMLILLILNDHRLERRICRRRLTAGRPLDLVLRKDRRSSDDLWCNGNDNVDLSVIASRGRE